MRASLSGCEALSELTMVHEWQYQIRLELEAASAGAARHEPAAPALEPLSRVLRKHGATLECQFDAFAAYVAEAERAGTERFPLYAWTKATIENPAKEAKYVKSFALHVEGEAVYAREKADALEADLRPFVGGPVVAAMSKHDTNPANNPQPPKRYRA